MGVPGLVLALVSLGGGLVDLVVGWVSGAVRSVESVGVGVVGLKVSSGARME